MVAPSFPQPMYEALRDLSQELLLPGLDTVVPDTRARAARPIARFVEAYMVGLNVEMARELLWRGFPTDQRGTYFDISGDDGAPHDHADIDDLRRPGTRARHGAAELRPREQFVLLLRSACCAATRTRSSI